MDNWSQDFHLVVIIKRDMDGAKKNLFLISLVFFPGISMPRPTIGQRLSSGGQSSVSKEIFGDSGHFSRERIGRDGTPIHNFSDATHLLQKGSEKINFSSNFRRPVSCHDRERFDDFRGFDREESRRNLWSKDKVGKSVQLSLKVLFKKCDILLTMFIDTFLNLICK